MKIAFTIADASTAVHAGGEVERRTFVSEVPDIHIHPEVIKALAACEKDREPDRKSGWSYLSVSLSIARC